MTHSPTCLFCGYSRSVPVAGCDHATLPAAGEEMAAKCDHGVVVTSGWHGLACVCCSNPAGYEDQPGRIACWVCRPAPTAGEEMAAAFRAMESARATEALLASELVDLQRQVVALQAELEQERREAGRLRADLENAQQLLSESEGEDNACETQNLVLREHVATLIDGLLDLAQPTTRGDYSTADLDRVVCRMATETLARVGVDAEAAFRAREAAREEEP